MKDEISYHMSESLVYISPNATITEAAKLMAKEKVGSVLIGEKGNYTGMVTEVDLTRKILAGEMDPKATRVSDIMNQTLITLDEKEPMDEAFLCIQKNHVRHILTTRDGAIVGILSSRDCARYYNQKFARRVDPIAEFWGNYEALQGRATFLYAVKSLIKNMRKSMDDTSPTAQSIDKEDDWPAIAECAEKEGLDEFAKILRSG